MKRIYTIIITLFAGFGLSAQSGVMFPFSRVDQNPVTAGMAGAGKGQCQLAYGAYANPSLMGLFEKNGELSFSYQMWMPSQNALTTHNPSLGFGYRIKNFAFSIAGTYMLETPYDVVLGPSGTATGTYRPYDLQVGLGLSYRIIKYLSIGVNGRFLRSDFAEEAKYNGMAFNAFVAYHQEFAELCTLIVTAGASNVGPKVKGGANSYTLPSSATAALSVDLHWSRVSLLADVDFDYYFSGAMSIDAGAQFGAWNRLFLRGGYHYAKGTVPVPSYATVGLGLQFGPVNINGNYMFANSVLANTFSVGIGFKF